MTARLPLALLLCGLVAGCADPDPAVGLVFPNQDALLHSETVRIVSAPANIGCTELLGQLESGSAATGADTGAVALCDARDGLFVFGGTNELRWQPLTGFESGERTYAAISLDADGRSVMFSGCATTAAPEVEIELRPTAYYTAEFATLQPAWVDLQARCAE